MHYFWNMRSALFFLICLLVFSCTSDRKPNFRIYYDRISGEKNEAFSYDYQRTAKIQSEHFKIDTIYRSMHGPISEKQFNLADSGEIVWLTGYEVNVYDTNGKLLPLEFMCHNNLNLADGRNFPWAHDNWSYFNRVFTLTQGITDMDLPAGFGIPLPSEQALKVVFQALNHNIPDLDSTLMHEVEIRYFLEKEIPFKMKPLFHQNIWLVKQYAGPPGVFGTPIPKGYAPDSTNFEAYTETQIPSCGIDMLANNQAMKLDYYWDNQGRKYTGHWKVPPGEEYLEFDATKLMNLDRNRKVHYLSAHIHPFCEYLELYDATDDTLLFRAEVENELDKTGIRSISHWSSEEGMDLKKGHQFVLKSKYNNQSQDTLSAMSVIYLFMGY